MSKIILEKEKAGGFLCISKLGIAILLSTSFVHHKYEKGIKKARKR